MRPGPASRRRIGLIFSIWVAYVGGAVGGGYLERTVSMACLGIPAALLAVIVGIELRTVSAAGRLGPR